MHGACTNTPVDHVANLEVDGEGGKMSFRGPANRSAALVISVSNMASQLLANARSHFTQIMGRYSRSMSFQLLPQGVIYV